MRRVPVFTVDVALLGLLLVTPDALPLPGLVGLAPPLGGGLRVVLPPPARGVPPLDPEGAEVGTLPVTLVEPPWNPPAAELALGRLLIAFCRSSRLAVLTALFKALSAAFIRLV